MSILINKESRIVIQGITGKEGLFHAKKMLASGSQIVAGVTPGKGGEWVLDDKIPVFDSVKAAIDVRGPDISIIFVPAIYATDAIIESIDAGISLIICITEGIPVKDMLMIKSYLENSKTRLIGPNSPGILTPKYGSAGIIPANIALPGNIGVVSRSGTLTYEIIFALRNSKLGVSTCIGIGGDPIIGTSFLEILKMFENDPLTNYVVLIGEIGGNDEEKASRYIMNTMTKPVFAYIAGESAPTNKRMGHAGAIIEKGVGSAKEKIQKLQEAGAIIAHHPEEIPMLICNFNGRAKLINKEEIVM